VLEWRVNRPRADGKRTPPLNCEDDSCPNCFSKPGCQYKSKDLKAFGEWLSTGMTPLSTYWESDGNAWLDGALPEEQGMCTLNGEGKIGSQTKGKYSGGSGCNDAGFTIDSFTLEDLQQPDISWHKFFERMDANSVVIPSAALAAPAAHSPAAAKKNSTGSPATVLTPTSPKPASRATLAPFVPAASQDAGLSPAGKSQGHAALGPEHSAKLLGKTLRMRVDISGIECGCVVGVYLVERGDGGACDASGYFPGRCGEIDIMEGNMNSWHSTLHNPMDQAGLCGGVGGVGQPDQNFGQGPRDMTSSQYGPGGSIIDTTKAFNAAVSFPQGKDGSLADMVVMMHQDGKEHAIEWRVNKPRADLTRNPPLNCEDDSCPNCYSNPGCQYKAKDLKAFGGWLSAGMTPLSTYWESDGNAWLDGALPEEQGMCTLNGEGRLGTQTKGKYAGGSGCHDAGYVVDSFTIEDIQEPDSSLEDFFEDMDNHPVVVKQ